MAMGSSLARISEAVDNTESSDWNPIPKMGVRKVSETIG
jgi:hypothetical protein